MNKNIIDYWRNSLADTQRMSPKISDLNGGTIEFSEFKAGQVKPEIAQKLIEQVRASIASKKGKQHATDDEEVYSANVAVAPFTLKERYEHSHIRRRGDSPSVAPIWIPAKVDIHGKLSVTDDKLLPWIERKCLEPVTTESFVLGNINDVDHYLANIERPTSLAWSELLEIATDLWAQITEKDIFAPDFPEYEVTKGYITLFADRGGSGAGLIKLCDRLRDGELEDEILTKTALRNLINTPVASQEPPATYLPITSKSHSGHIGQHVLAPSQRQSLTAVLSTEVSDIVAINGPPGTGKTTLVQSILASEIVNSARRGKDPFIALACSTNNQAVTNLIDSLGNAARPIENDQLSKRWISGVNSLGLYFPSATATKKTNLDKYLVAKTSGVNFPELSESTDFIQNAKREFITQAQTYFGNDALLAEQTTSALHEHLCSLCDSFEEFVDHVEMLRRRSEELNKSGFETFEKWIASASDKQKQTQDHQTNIEHEIAQ